MSSLSKLLSISALAICSAAALAAVDRGQEEGTQVDLRRPGPARKDVEAAARKAKAPEDRLRCWQYGKLIFDGRVMAPAEKSPNVTELRTSPGRSLQLMDMNHGFCISETASR